jgi:protein-disulfide isomerase
MSAATGLKVAVSDQDHIQGSESAEITLVEYGDYECSHCGEAYAVVKRLQKHYGDALRFVFRNFPLSESHPLAEPAAESAEFAATHGKFWEMHDGIFEHQSTLSLDLLRSLAKKNGMDTQALTDALDKHTFRERVKKDFGSGLRSGVNGTPTFFINGQRHDTDPDFDGLVKGIEAARASAPDA